MYMQLEGMQLFPEPKTTEAERYTPRKKQQSSYGIRDLTTSWKDDSHRASIPKRRPLKDGLCPRPLQVSAGGWQGVGYPRHEEDSSTELNTCRAI